MAEDELTIADDFPAASKADWRELVEGGPKGKPVERLRAESPDGIEIEPLYAQQDAPGPDAAGWPGLPPFVRGRLPLGLVEGGWRVHAETDHPMVETAGEALRRELARGATGLTLRVGIERGTRILTAGDLAVVLEGVDLASIPVVLEPGVDFLPVGAAFVAVARSRDVPLDRLRGSFGADPLRVLAETGTLQSGLEGTWRELGELAVWSREHAPSMKVARVSVVPHHEAGATPALELAFATATSIEYLRRLLAAGLSIEEAASSIDLSFAVGSDFFTEIAKLRAARLLWSKVVAAFGGSEAAQAVEIHARCSMHTKSRRDPWVNMLRGTAEVFAAAVGGADAITAVPFDAAIGPSDEGARRLARNTQLILREESRLHRSVDPAGGSWYVETLVDRLARAAWEQMQQIERGGGMSRAHRLGRVASAVRRASKAERERIARRSKPLVGVSEYANADEKRLSRPAPSVEDLEEHVGRAFGEADVRSRYDALLQFARLASGQEDGEPGQMAQTAVEATLAGVDLFSLGSVMRNKRPSLYVAPLSRWRAAEPWETLREAADTYRKIRGKPPRCFLANLGPIPEHRARADYAFNLFTAAGIEPVTNDGFESAREAAEAFERSEADMAIVCGSDARYGEMAAEVGKALSDRGAKRVLLAGKPGEREDELRQAGIDGFAHRGADVLSLLSTIHRDLGVSK